MYRRNPVRDIFSGISGGIVLIGIALAFVFGGGGFNLPVFFLFLGFSILFGSLGSLNPRGVYGGIIGFFWMLILALFFITGSWIWFLVGAGISAIMGALLRPIMAGLLGLGIFGMASTFNQRQQPTYQPPPYQQQYQSYQQGYQPPQPTYQEGGQQYQYPQQDEQPQAQYPQEMPPQQQ